MKETILPAAHFLQDFLRLNDLHSRGFAAWIFHPGMLFGSEEKWWGKSGRRWRPHEGIDLCYYRDTHGILHGLPPGAGVPALYAGTVAGIVDDFLGQSVFVAHELFAGRHRLYSLYGHTVPRKDLQVGTVVEAGEQIAVVASSAGKKLPPHLHLSLAWVGPSVSPETLGWDALAEPGIVLIDPRAVPGLPGTEVHDIVRQRRAGPPDH